MKEWLFVHNVVWDLRKNKFQQNKYNYENNEDLVIEELSEKEALQEEGVTEEPQNHKNSKIK